MPVQKLIPIIKWSLIIGITYSAATTALFLLSPPAVETKEDKIQKSRKQPTILDTTLIISKNLFGTSLSEIQDNELDIDEIAATETRLPLELLSIFASENNLTSSAIIAEKGKKAVIYSEGDTLPGNIRITKVNSDHVLLLRKSALESLTFGDQKNQALLVQTGMKGKHKKSSRQAPSSSNPFKKNEVAEKQKLTSLNVRNSNSNEIRGMLSELGVSAVSLGKSKGYRVGGLVNSAYLSQTGLQPGDLILSVNGQPVGDIEKDKLEIENILAQGSARLEIQRGDRIFFVTAAL